MCGNPDTSEADETPVCCFKLSKKKQNYPKGESVLICEKKVEVIGTEDCLCEPTGAAGCTLKIVSPCMDDVPESESCTSPKISERLIQEEIRIETPQTLITPYVPICPNPKPANMISWWTVNSGCPTEDYATNYLITSTQSKTYEIRTTGSYPFTNGFVQGQYMARGSAHVQNGAYYGTFNYCAPGDRPEFPIGPCDLEFTSRYIQSPQSNFEYCSYRTNQGYVTSMQATSSISTGFQSAGRYKYFNRRFVPKCALPICTNVPTTISQRPNYPLYMME